MSIFGFSNFILEENKNIYGNAFISFRAIETKTFYLDIFYTNYVADILQKELRAFQGVVMTQEMHL